MQFIVRVVLQMLVGIRYQIWLVAAEDEEKAKATVSQSLNPAMIVKQVTAEAVDKDGPTLINTSESWPGG